MGKRVDKYEKHDNDFLYELPEMQAVLNREIDPLTSKEKWRGWYMRKFWQLGKDEVLRLAAIARADSQKDARKYFSRLIIVAAKQKQ